ncbi:MAG TPA: hypothetical protein VFC63_19675 [Blastocatellia bacterium]|nr:hypothetical protein [Blastocatellia bacterium]
MLEQLSKRHSSVAIILLLAGAVLIYLGATFAGQNRSPSQGGSQPLRIDFVGNRAVPPRPTVTAVGTAGPPLRVDFQGVHPVPVLPTVTPVGTPGPPLRIDFSGSRAETRPARK